MAGHKGNACATHRASHDHVRRFAKGRVQAVLFGVLQSLHLVEAAASNDAYQSLGHIFTL